MRLRTFTAPDMNRAMVMVREALGDDAVIISTSRDANNKAVSVTAAIEEEVFDVSSNDWDGEVLEVRNGGPSQSGWDNYLSRHSEAKRKVEQEPQERPAPPRVAPLRDISHSQFIQELEEVLTFHHTPDELIEQMVRVARFADKTRHKDLEELLAIVLEQVFSFMTFDLELVEKGHACKMMLVGAAGAGKTLTVAKLTADRVAENLPIHVISVDNKRAGSVEQLQAFTHIMGIETHLAMARSELREHIRSLPANEPVVIDSFATNPYVYKELKELTDFANLHGIEPVLAIPAGMDAYEAEATAQAFAFLGIKRLVVTRLDAARRYGSLLHVAYQCNLAFSHGTTSPQVAGGLIPIDAHTLSHLLLQHRQEG